MNVIPSFLCQFVCGNISNAILIVRGNISIPLEIHLKVPYLAHLTDF